MLRRSNLKLVEGTQFYRKELALWSEDGGSSHSLHQLLTLPSSIRSQCAAYFVDKFSQAGDTILDPFCGSGTVALEAISSGRIVYASDSNPLAVETTRAKIEPADITEVTLALQMINLKRPVDVALYRRSFASFYDLDTFREIVNMRAGLQNRDDKTSQFLRIAAASLLHGHTASYFSVYSAPHISLTPIEQERLNVKRRQSPDYRSIMPRILRKCASTLRDGFPSTMRQHKKLHRIGQSDSRSLSYVPNASVNLLLTAPPIPGEESDIQASWLKLWFCGYNPDDIERFLFTPQSDNAREEWLEFMNETLFESARVVKPGGRAVLLLPDALLSLPGKPYDEDLLNMVSSNLSKFWDTECSLVNLLRATESGDPKAARSGAARSSRSLVLRRR